MTFKNILFFILITSIIACKSNDKECNFSETPVPPSGFSITSIGEIADSISAEARYFQMVNSTVGYAYKGQFSNDEISSYFLKTNDGAKTWTSTPIAPISPTAMFFADENNGYICHRGTGDNPNILKTTDGGLTWEDLSFPEYSVLFQKMTKDDNGNLYASLSGFADYNGIVKSTDNGLSWSEIYANNNSFSSNFILVDERIYFKESSGRLKIIGLQGNSIRSITINGSEQISVADENNIIVVDQYKVNKTEDGGDTWVEIFDNEAHIIDFSVDDGLLLFLNKDYCGDFLSELSAFGKGNYDENVFEESDLMINFEAYLLENVQKIGSGHYLLQRNNEILELKKL